MDKREPRQYLVVVVLYNYSTERLLEVGTGLVKVLDRVSTEPIEMAFRSVSRDIIAYLIRAKLNAGQLRAAIESPQRGYVYIDPITPGFLRNDDNLIVIELGEDKSASQGLSRALTWLQRH